MIETLFYLAIIYVCIAVPIKLWASTEKYKYLKKDTDVKIEDLQFNNTYYVDLINQYQSQLKHMTSEKDRFYGLWSEALDTISEIEDFLLDIPDNEFKSQIEEILYPPEEVDEVLE